jgi:DNA-directed RNA polymerase specialized sigma24 family protein
MSKARLVITAVVVEGRFQGEAARGYGVSQGWVSKLVARYRLRVRRRLSRGHGGRRPVRRLSRSRPRS